MSWTSTAIEQLASQAAWGYRADSVPATEPTALAALALIGHGQSSAAQRSLQWLAELQSATGTVGITQHDATPAWPTSLALLAWQFADEQAEPRYTQHIERGVDWLLSAKGDPLEKVDALGHDPTLIGWPWVLGTHSWLEPTAWAVLALSRCGQAQHPRTIEGTRLLIDRLLPTGGANYGNTYVLGQKLRPHIEPTGLALIALAGQSDPAGRIDASCTYLARQLSASTTAISLSYGLLGLAAHDQLPAPAMDWLEVAYRRTADQPLQPLRLALSLLAALGADSPLVRHRPQLARTP